MTTKYFNKTWCDGPGCSAMKIFREFAPNPTWWSLSYWTFAEKGDDKLVSEMLDFDFCSLSCLEAWCTEQSSKEAA